MKRLVCLLLPVVVGCASLPERPPPLFPVDRAPEARALPEHPADLDLSEYPGEEDGLEPVAEGESVPFDGFVSSERRFARDTAYRAAYPALREALEARNREWAAQRALYEEELARLAMQVQRLQPTWWDRYQGIVWFVVGFGLGAWGTVEVARALHGKDKP